MIPPVFSDPLFPYTAAAVQRLRDEFAADRLAAELGCEVTPHPGLAGHVEAWDAMPGLRVVAGTPDRVRDQVREHGLREWLAVLGKQGRQLLTPREREVAALVAEGLTDQQIARRLSVGLRTVHAHLRNSYAKTGVRNRVSLANWLRDNLAPPLAYRPGRGAWTLCTAAGACPGRGPDLPAA